MKLRRILAITALALVTVGAANAQSHDFFKVVITNHGFVFEVGSFHDWRYDRHDRCYYDRRGHRHSIAEYAAMLNRERREREAWERNHRDYIRNRYWDEDRREYRHDNGRHLGWYKDRNRDRDRDDRDRGDRDRNRGRDRGRDQGRDRGDRDDD